MSDLKPCPFCGYDGKIVVIKNMKGASFGACADPFCNCQLSVEETYDEAKKKWNTRKDSTNEREGE